MKRAIIKSDIILILLIIIFLGIVFAFADFSSKDKEKNYNINVYKAYYLYDKESKPISLSYNMLNIDNSTSKEKIITKVFDTISNNISDTIELKDIAIDKDVVTLVINEDVSNYDNTSLECLINSIIEINNYSKVIIECDNGTKEYKSTIDNYYINSPIVNKLYTFLYRDKNYKIIYIDENNNENELKIVSSKDKYVTYQINDENYKWIVKKDGLYLEDDKVLSSSYKVEDSWDNKKIIDVSLDKDNTLLITILISNDDNSIKYILKQGIGIIYYEKRDIDNNIINSFTYKEKIFNEG